MLENGVVFDSGGRLEVARCWQIDNHVIPCELIWDIRALLDTIISHLRETSPTPRPLQQAAPRQPLFQRRVPGGLRLPKTTAGHGE